MQYVATADGYQRPDVSSPAMLRDFNKVVGAYVAGTQSDGVDVGDLAPDTHAMGLLDHRLGAQLQD